MDGAPEHLGGGAGQWRAFAGGAKGTARMSAVKIGLVVVVLVAVAGVAVCLRRGGRSRLPEHLRAFFKNRAELDRFLKEQGAAEDKRLAELTDPGNAEEAAEYLSLHGYDAATPTFEKALGMVEAALQDNPCDYGQLLGEMYAFSEAYRDAERAYYYYFIGLSQHGYSVGFRDMNHDPPNYGGPVGDFRNESQVSALVDELGWDKVKQIDLEARAWLTENGFEVVEFL